MQVGNEYFSFLFIECAIIWKSIFYWMNNNMKMNSLLFFSLFVWIRLWKCMNAWGYEDTWMNALTLFETIFLF